MFEIREVFAHPTLNRALDACFAPATAQLILPALGIVLRLRGTRQEESNIFLAGIALRDDSKRFVKSCLLQVLSKLFPVDQAIDNPQIVVHQVDLACPDPPMKLSECGQVFNSTDRLAR